MQISKQRDLEIRKYATNLKYSNEGPATWALIQKHRMRDLEENTNHTTSERTVSSSGNELVGSLLLDSKEIT